MGSRDRDTKSIQEKLKVFFKKAGVPARGELQITADMERELSADSPLSRRLRAVRDLSERALQLRIQDGGVERVWCATRDLLHSEAASEARAAVLALLRCVAEGQADRLTVMRTVMFHYLRDTHADHPPDDTYLRFRLLHTLTNTGKNITCFEEQIGAFLVEWMAQIQNASVLVELMQLVTNVVKYNASSLDEDIVHGIVNVACARLESAGGAGGAGGGEDGAAALALLEAVVSYSLLPRAALRDFVRALCRQANVEAHTPHCWKLMRGVAGGDLGPAALLEMLEAARGPAPALARGAVFYVYMALWGPRRVPRLQPSLLAVLPALRRAADLRQPAVTYEVLQALQALLARGPRALDEPAADLLLRLLRAVLDHDDPNDLVQQRLHALISAVEALQQAGGWPGELEALLELVEAAGPARPEASSTWAVQLRLQEAPPWRAGWAPAVLRVAERFLRAEPRRAVRLYTLDAIKEYALRHQLAYGEEVVERVAVPVLGACGADADGALRAAAVRAAAELARRAPPDAAADLVDLLERALSRPYEATGAADDDAADVVEAARGLLELVHERLTRAPAGPAARAALVLLDHLEQHYRRPAPLRNHPEVRLLAFEMVLGLRVNAYNCVGFCYDGSGRALWGAAGAAPHVRPVCSPHVLVEGAAGRGGALLAGGRAARCVVAALSRDREWLVLGTVLRALPALLAVRALCVGRRAQELDLLAGTLCAMLSDRSLYFPECIRVTPPQKLTQSEFQALVLAALAAMAPYHAWLEPHTQQRIVRSLLRFGMVLRAPQPYINALTIFTLEMRETMVKMLPEVLLDLSKISDTKLIASPMLEFLSTLTRLPRVFASFVEDQYMSVFAILLPYTNPSRYNHYVVSLAHHVIAAWFLKCRLSYRRNFVRFIIHGLHNYIILPFEERLQRAPQPPANEDSSNRQRSSSLGSRAASRVPAAGGASARGGGATAAAAAPAPAAFHVELTETCVDLLARYAHTPVSVKPSRGDTAHWLFAAGNSSTWLVGHKLVTVTTSGCQQNPARLGMCERCAALCRRAPPPPLALEPPPLAPADEVAHPDDALSKLLDRLERITHDADVEEAAWARGHAAAAGAGAGAAGGAGGGACPCWCTQWAEVRVRAPTGDTAWVTRLQNAATPQRLHDDPYEDVVALLAAPPPAAAAAPAAAAPPPAAPPPAAPSADLSKSQSESAVPARGPARSSTQPINIPGSPARRSTSASDDDDVLILPPVGKARQPVRRSNSSPEMSSWKREEAVASPAAAAPLAPAPPPAAAAAAPAPAPAPPSTLAKKPAKKSNDMRVSCEAIPEEMSGTSPAGPAHPALPAHPAHPALATFASDPGEVGADELPPLARSKRSNTISVMSPTRRSRDAAAAARGASGGGLQPAFVFLQLYHNMSTYPITPPVPGEAPTILNPLAERPLKVSGVQHERTIKNLDLVPPLETYKVGVLYVGAGQQDDEVAILRNEHGSLRYSEFLAALGTLVSLEDGDEQPDLFLNLEKGGKDGRYTYVWTDDIMQVQFHVATAMPSSAKDPNCNEKRKYIGNDFVSIVYNDSGADFNILTIKGQFNFCVVVVEPFEHGMNRVLVKTKDERIRTKFLAHVETHVVSDANVALLARQVALHCALASQISQSLRVGGAPYASNALERLRIIKRLRARAEAERAAAAAARAPAPYHHHAPHIHDRVAIDDFNDYT